MIQEDVKEKHENEKKDDVNYDVIVLKKEQTLKVFELIQQRMKQFVAAQDEVETITVRFQRALISPQLTLSLRI